MHPYSLLACRKKITGLCQLSLDAQFCEYVIEKFVERDTPILTIYDSLSCRLARNANSTE